MAESDVLDRKLVAQSMAPLTKEHAVGVRKPFWTRCVKGKGLPPLSNITGFPYDDGRDTTSPGDSAARVVWCQHVSTY